MTTFRLLTCTSISLTFGDIYLISFVTMKAFIRLRGVTRLIQEAQKTTPFTYDMYGGILALSEVRLGSAAGPTTLFIVTIFPSFGILASPSNGVRLRIAVSAFLVGVILLLDRYTKAVAIRRVTEEGRKR